MRRMNVIRNNVQSARDGIVTIHMAQCRFAIKIKQRNRFFAIAKSDELNMSDADIKAKLFNDFGTESTREISFTQMVEITRELDKMQQQARKARSNVQQG